jgi:hypothetical protein
VAARWILVGALVLLAYAAPPAAASTIVYQCGEAVCAIDPDTGAKPRQLTAQGRNAGVTADGRTASWVDPAGTLVQASVAGGAPRPVPYDGQVVNQPSMSPDGARYLWWYPALGAVWINRLTVGQPTVDGVSYCGGCTTTHGWLGAQAIAAFPGDALGRDSPSTVCTVATEEESGISGSCVARLVSDARGGIGFPSGNAAGTEIVAVLTPGELTGVEGRIVRYSLASGAPIGDVTAGATDTTPVFSPEGDRIAFDRDDQIVVKDLTSGAERVLGPGVYPFWGGVSVRVAQTLRARSLKRGRATVGVGCAGACRVGVSLDVARRTARRLGLRGTRTIAKGSGSRTSSGTAELRLRATRKSRKRLGRVRSYRATLRVSVTPQGGAATQTSTRLRVRR